jgi:transposase
VERYIGLDAHTASCTLAVVGPSGRRLREQVVETDGEALVGAVRSIGGQRHLCLEEGELSGWLYELLKPHVARIVVAQAMREPGPKSDAIDAFGWAERLRTKAIRTAVFKAPERYAALRELGRTYRLVTEDLVRAKNRLKSLYRRRGVAASGEAIYREADRESWLEHLPASARVAGQALHAEVDGLTLLKQQVREHLLAEASRHSVVSLLKTAPGVGPLRAAQLVPIVVTPHRFRTARQFWAYCGLAVVMRTSSDWVQLADRRWIRAKVNSTRGLNRNRSPVLKAIFKGAATTVIAQPAGSSALRDKYERLIDGGTKPNLAKLTIARKIAAIALRIWRDNSRYDEQTHRERMK